MGNLTRVCGIILMTLGPVIFLGGFWGLGKSGQGHYSAWTEFGAYMTMGSAVGVFLWGVFFCALAEIIHRLPPPAELVEEEPRD